MKVLVAMSGGVDSAVAAARLVAAGHDVTGVHLALSKNPASYRSGARGCCSLEDSHDARRVADKLDIPFYVWDFADEFHEAVVEDFVAEYQAGRTPNPCLRCNEKIKFAAVLNRGIALGFDAVATGHYARLERRDDGTVSLYRAADAAKDQSYVLGMLNQEQLAHCLFPIYDVEKSVVRAEAKELGFGVAKKPDSHDICFIADGDTQGFLGRYLDDSPGPIVDSSGTVLGEHRGTHRYTVGQRKGLDLKVPAPGGEPRYVLRIEPVNRTVVVGAREELAVTTLRGIRPSWTEDEVAGPWRGFAQYRAHGIPQPATIEVTDGAMTVALDEPASGVAPGQTVVVYDGDRVVGSAVIAEAS
ncbi:MAG TPA: tRNA 2-thiouridine(34) synthase MnmA [Tessaracoccus flavescens]|uniref:tRNA-specific 2-thiouridylase MnmA n=1 Tax=Tessaracoccus flavescens TaxID=399497 RepID=A0A921EMV2_9ACTN|nr:tRNA 2-thiouridine(34) synthase MnmA [Tessaracoccus flavescens]